MIQRELTIGILNLNARVKSVISRINAWFTEYESYIKRWQTIVTDIKGSEVKDFEVFSVAIRELGELAQANKNKEK